MSSRKYQMKKREGLRYVNMKGNTIGNNNAVKDTIPVYTSMQADFKLVMLLHKD